jgi:hypothetical protein
VFFQIPNASKILKDFAFWDIYYEHCSYYTPESLMRLFSGHGFKVVDLGFEYDDQYLTIEARPSPSGKTDPSWKSQSLGELEQAVAGFEAQVPEWIETWRGRLSRYKEGRRRVVIWGSGSKGVAFLTAADVDCSIEYVVDINPYRQNQYMAKTAQKIVSPEFLVRYRPQVVIVMNPVYRDEIAAEMLRLGVVAEIVTT